MASRFRGAEKNTGAAGAAGRGRATGFGTGPCQGKSCLNAVVQELIRLGATPAEIAAGKSFAEVADRRSLLPKAEKDGGDMGMKARN